MIRAMPVGDENSFTTVEKVFKKKCNPYSMTEKYQRNRVVTFCADKHSAQNPRCSTTKLDKLLFHSKADGGPRPMKGPNRSRIATILLHEGGRVGVGGVRLQKAHILEESKTGGDPQA